MLLLACKLRKAQSFLQFPRAGLPLPHAVLHFKDAPQVIGVATGLSVPERREDKPAHFKPWRRARRRPSHDRTEQAARMAASAGSWMYHLFISSIAS